MINQNLLDYLYTYILKKGEKLDLNNMSESRFIDIPIVKSTKRTFRRLGMITIGTLHPEENEEEIDVSLENKKLTPRKKLKLNEDAIQTLKWIEEGWILKEYRFKQDGRTLDSTNYRMGYRLFQQQIKIKEQLSENITKELNQLSNEILKLRVLSDQPFIKQQMFKNIKEKYVTVCDIRALNESELFSKNWSLKKRMNFLHFILAISQIGSSKDQFDWKEIGATYYKSIGGSKVFDRNQVDFLYLLDEWSGYPAVEFGLTSLGYITPIFFSGHLNGRYSSFEYGPVHAVTNLSLSEEQYETSATTLWIVENRGILTRLSSQKNFLEKSSTFTLCCDGHIRSAHRHFIEQIIQHSDLNQVIIWTDYDQDGMTIAGELYNIAKKGIQAIKWIGPSGETLKNWTNYEQEMNEFLKDKKMEQEEMTGDVILWRKWINS